MAAPCVASVTPTDPEWMSERLGRKVSKVTSKDLSDAGGWSGEMLRLTVEFADGGAPASYVFKQTKAGREAFGKSMGLPREGLFYRDFAPALAKICDLAEVVFATGDMEAGHSAVLMEDLCGCVQSGYFFGPGSPHNWDKDLAAVTKGWQLTAGAVTALAFAAGARLHAAFWQREDLWNLDKGWLRGAPWLRGADRESWQTYQDQAIAAWAVHRPKPSDGETAPPSEEKVNWHPEVVALLDAGFAKVSWDDFQGELKKKPWTLVHGDFHPANMLVRPGPGGDATGAAIAVLDFEQVGLGSGPQDLGQYLISHCDPAERAVIERGAVEEYYRLLCSLNPSVAATLSWELCWAEYREGGLGRWLWFLPILAGLCSPKMTQYFQDQVLAFSRAHGFNALNVPMPRV